MTRRPRSLESLVTRLGDLPTDTHAGNHSMYRTADLRGVGLGTRAVRAAIEANLLIRVRKGGYMLAGAPADVVSAAREGGRVACVSRLAELGVFVLSNPELHLHLSSSTAKAVPKKRTAVWHWAPLIRDPHPRATSVEVIDALTQATACQPSRAAVATLDSALHLGLIGLDDLDEIFERVPARCRGLRQLIDGRAESGPETIVRLIALALGFSVELQVRFRGGRERVDLVLDGWLVVECDSQEFHTGWESQKKDRGRDLALAALGMTSLRPVAEDIMYHPERVEVALRGLRDARRRWVAAECAPNAG